MKTKIILMSFIALSIISCKKKKGGETSICLKGSSTMSLALGSSFSDPGASATDGNGNELTVKKIGVVNKDSLGNYTIKYEATDGESNTVSVTRKVNVVMTPTVALGVYDIDSDCTTASSLKILGSNGNNITFTANGTNGLTLDHPDASNAGVDQNRGPFTGTIDGSLFTNVSGVATIDAFGTHYTYTMTGSGVFSSDGDTLTIDYSWPADGPVNGGTCTATYVKH